MTKNGKKAGKNIYIERQSKKKRESTDGLIKGGPPWERLEKVVKNNKSKKTVRM